MMVNGETITATLVPISEHQKVLLEKELNRKQLPFSVVWDKVKRQVRYTITLKAKGQYYLLPADIRKAIGVR